MSILYCHTAALTIGEVNRYTVTVSAQKLKEAGITLQKGKIWVRIRNASSKVLRAAYLTGPYVLAASVTSSTYSMREQTPPWDTPAYDPHIKAGSSFYTTLFASPAVAAGPHEDRTFIFDLSTQVLFTHAHVEYEITLASSSAALRRPSKTKPHQALSVKLEDTNELWRTPELERGVHDDIHLVVITHGLQSNTGADMLYMKQQIEHEAGVKKFPKGGVVVSGFTDNSCRTLRGVKYLGRRVAEWVLKETRWYELEKTDEVDWVPYSRISFIGHSLGGLVQTYALGYIYDRTRGEFFNRIRPVNFVTLASPWLGVSAENPGYVKLALDLGVLGKTGQDLGLTFRPNQQFHQLSGDKPVRIRDHRPLLRIMALEDGPCHAAVRLFKSHTLYANVVNDGIVPLRTASLFFLDWASFERVEKSRAKSLWHTGQGLWHTLGPGVGPSHRSATLTGFVKNKFRGSDDESDREIAEGEQLKSQNRGWEFLKQHLQLPSRKDAEDTQSKTGDGEEATSEKPKSGWDTLLHHMLPGTKSPSPGSTRRNSPTDLTFQLAQPKGIPMPPPGYISEQSAFADQAAQGSDTDSPAENSVKPRSTMSTPCGSPIPDDARMDVRIPGQGTESKELRKEVKVGDNDDSATSETHVTAAPDTQQSESNPLTSVLTLLRPHGGRSSRGKHIPKMYRRSQTKPTPDELASKDFEGSGSEPPPKSTWFESAHIMINPPLPPAEWLVNPKSRRDVIFHDRIYRPSDIPPAEPDAPAGPGSPGESTAAKKRKEKLKLEEKIARAWHKDIEWRKVLVRLEPDAHNNIVVRRQFANAFGWGVVEHLVQEHFAVNEEDVTSSESEDITDSAEIRPPLPSVEFMTRRDTAPWHEMEFENSEDETWSDDEDQAGAIVLAEVEAGIIPG
ncbi:hypothetical protein YB2330_000270 [Saitoella coloradoensis]